MILAGNVPEILLFSGFGVLFGLVGWRLTILANLDKAKDDAVALGAITRQIERNAAALGLWWGCVTGALMLRAGADQRMLMGLIAAGMMGAGSISFRSLKRAARNYVTLFGLGAFAGFAATNTPSAFAACGLTICFTIVLCSNITKTARDITGHLVKQREAEAAADTITLLLNDFTEQGSGWLFELDDRGALVHVSERIAHATMRAVQTLDGTLFCDLFETGNDVAMLADHIASGRAFRDCIVPLRSGDDQRWWCISARPASGGQYAYRGVITDITAQRQAEEKVSYMAHYDGLTDLPNRFRFNDALHQAFKRRNARVGLMYLDLDNFKSINDTLGHPTGDKLLEAVARRLEDCVTSEEMVARLGGDEFAILIGSQNIDQIAGTAERIVEAMAQPFELGGHNVVIGTSIGIAIAPDHGENGERLLQNADLALYTAKSLGRNRAAIFEQGMDQAAHARRLLELDLRSSLGKDEMRLHYQPVIEISTGETTGYEALIRWEHPTRGTVMPNAFIPIAEETGMIVQIGEWVIRQALRDLALWDEHLAVSINLSAAQMRSVSLVTTVINALAYNGIDPGRVCLEITETVLMQDSAVNIETLHKLNGLGVKIALDDFGTGYSSLNYLRSFPFDKIKIDRCFVEEIDTREDCQAIVRSVVSLANSLGMTTTAEGVERTGQFEQLRKQGCSEVQGFLYSKAVPVHELSDLRSRKYSRGPIATLIPAAGTLPNGQSCKRVSKLKDTGAIRAADRDSVTLPRRRSGYAF